MTQKKKSSFLQFVVTFAIIYLVTSLALRYFFPQMYDKDRPAPQPVILSTQKSLVMGRDVQVTVANATEQPLSLPNRCPDPPLIIERELGEKLVQLDLSKPVTECEEPASIAPVSREVIDLSPWKYAAFPEAGHYVISLPDEALAELSAPVEDISIRVRVKEPGVFVQLFRSFISKPLLNGMVFIASLLPNHSLGWSIIIVTLIVKLLLFFPSQHALESQKRMQAIQPKLDAIKKKYKNDQQKITQETMALWKREKINPFQSCLPTLIQLPILIGLFFIIRDSGNIAYAKHLLYAPFVNLDWSFTTVFLGFLDLRSVPFAGATWIPSITNIGIVLSGAGIPLAISLMQFVQMKMAFDMKKKKDSKKDGKKKEQMSSQQTTQNMMLYMLPVMIFFISGTLPTAVSLYWGASTLFSIGQQVFVNRKSR